MRYNLGCGLDIRKGWVNVDGSEALRNFGVEIWDLEEMPWPFPPGDASEIRAVDVFEHIEPKLRPGFMVECWQLLEDRGTLFIQTAHYTCIDAYTDPTHYGAGFTEQTFDFWVRGTVHFRHKNPMYGGVEFEKVKVELNRNTGQLEARLRKVRTDA